jgi:hypothetical protein
MIFKRIIIALTIFLPSLFLINLQAQTVDSLSVDSSSTGKGVFVSRDSVEKNKDTTGIHKGRLASVIGITSGLYISSMAYLEYVWYKDKKRVPFEFYNDIGVYNQMDKMGHMYSSYLETYLGFHSLLWAGVPRNKAIWYGGMMGFLLQIHIEIWDGLYEDWGFSWSDVGANTLGCALVVGQELAFKEQIVKYKLSFSPSPYARQANGYLGRGIDQFFLDYNGHTYWLSVGLNRLIPSKRIPNWLSIAFGYSAGGMFGPYKNLIRYRTVPIPETERFRQFLFSLDIDFSKIKTNNKFLKSLFDAMFIVKVPFPTLEYNTKGELKFYPLYY